MPVKLTTVLYFLMDVHRELDFSDVLYILFRADFWVFSCMYRERWLVRFLVYIYEADF